MQQSLFTWWTMRRSAGVKSHGNSMDSGDWLNMFSGIPPTITFEHSSFFHATRRSKRLFLNSFLPLFFVPFFGSFVAIMLLVVSLWQLIFECLFDFNLSLCSQTGLKGGKGVGLLASPRYRWLRFRQPSSTFLLLFLSRFSTFDFLQKCIYTHTKKKECYEFFIIIKKIVSIRYS